MRSERAAALRASGSAASVRATALGLLALGVTLAGARPSRADDAPAAPAAPAAAPTPAPAREVVLEIAAEDARDGDALAQVARELLGRLGVGVRAALVSRVELAAVVASPPPGTVPDAHLARVWIDWRTPGRATLYLLDARRDRVLVRQVERPAGGEELAREELGHILETACEGLLAGGEVGEPRAGMAPLLAPPAPAPPAAGAPAAGGEGRSRLSAAVLYEAAALAPEAPLTHGPEASLFLDVRPGAARARPWAYGAWATAQLRLPVRADDGGGAGVELQAFALRALLAIERGLSARAVARAGLGGGVDVVHARPEASPSDAAVLAPAFTRAFAVGRAAVALDLRLARWTWLVACVAADVDVTGQRYAFARGGGGEDLVVRPWVVRPAAALGLAFP
jgi:hypothetical protein